MRTATHIVPAETDFYLSEFYQRQVCKTANGTVHLRLPTEKWIRLYYTIQV